MAYRNYGPANGFVVNPNGQGDFTTIASALTAATSGATIYLYPGTYTENPTLKAGVNLVAFDADALTPNVTINGKCTFTGAGTVSISGVQLKTNSDYFLEITGSAASVVQLSNCYLNCLNNTGIHYTSSSSSSGIQIANCIGNIATTGISLFTATGSGAVGTFPASCGISLIDTVINNNGGASTASTTSACQIGASNCRFFFPFSATSTGTFNFFAVDIETQNQNATCITTAGTGSNNFELNHLRSGTASAISIGSGTTVQFYGGVINSSNTNAVTGLGTFNYGGITYPSTSTINPSTANPVAYPVPEGGTGVTSFANTSALICSGTTTTGALQNVASVATGQVLTSAGTSTLPSWSATPSVTSITVGGGTAFGNYVQGSWTPTLNINSSTTGITYSEQVGEYTQIGNIVFYAYRITLSSKGSSTGSVTMTGLPVSQGGTAASGMGIEFDAVTLTANYNTLINATGGSTMFFTQCGSGQSDTNLTNTNLANNSTLRGGGFYFTS